MMYFFKFKFYFFNNKIIYNYILFVFVVLLINYNKINNYKS